MAKTASTARVWPSAVCVQVRGDVRPLVGRGRDATILPLKSHHKYSEMTHSLTRLLNK